MPSSICKWRTNVEEPTDTAILAPSAMNLHPWAFPALLNRERISNYAKRIKDCRFANFDQTSFDPSIRTMRKPIEGENYSVFHNTPALVLVLATSPLVQASDDCCLAAQNLMLAARDEGLGTCCIGLARHWLNLPSTKREMGLPAASEVVVPIVLGHPKAWPDSHGRNPAQIYWLG